MKKHVALLILLISMQCLNAAKKINTEKRIMQLQERLSKIEQFQADRYRALVLIEEKKEKIAKLEKTPWPHIKNKLKKEIRAIELEAKDLLNRITAYKKTINIPPSQVEPEIAKIKRELQHLKPWAPPGTSIQEIEKKAEELEPIPFQKTTGKAVKKKVPFWKKIISSPTKPQQQETSSSWESKISSEDKAYAQRMIAEARQEREKRQRLSTIENKAQRLKGQAKAFAEKAEQMKQQSTKKKWWQF